MNFLKSVGNFTLKAVSVAVVTVAVVVADKHFGASDAILDLFTKE